jgi:hypothetical protein
MHKGEPLFVLQPKKINVDVMVKEKQIGLK